MDNSVLRESLFSDAHRFLLCDAANLELLAVCRDWLRSLGFDLQRLDGLPIGVFPSPLVMKEGLLRAGFSIDEIAASGLVGDPRLAERLIGPIRDASGHILSFWARHPEGLRPKYLFLGRDWKQETPAFGLDAAMPHLNDTAGELLLVEDLLDALLLQSAGLPQVAATLRFSSNLTPPRWEQLAALGVRRVTLVPSDEEQGLVRAVAARAAALEDPAPEAFVLLPESFGRVRDLAELIRAMSPETFWSWLRANRVPRTDDLSAEATAESVPLLETSSAEAVPESVPLLGTSSVGVAEDATSSFREVEEAPLPRDPPPRPTGLCPFHDCDPMFCFCWD
jgi:hypothetical protein